MNMARIERESRPGCPHPAQGREPRAGVRSMSGHHSTAILIMARGCSAQLTPEARRPSSFGGDQ